MSKYFHHKPNVPQPPYNLNFGEDTRAAQPPPRGSSQLQRMGSQNNLGRAAVRTQQGQSLPPAIPPVPTRAAAPAPAPAQTTVTPPTPPQDYYNPHQQSYYSLTTGPLRAMSAQERQAYILSVDARNAAEAAAMPMASASDARPSGLRPLQLATSTLQQRQPSPHLTPGTPPSDDESLSVYLKQLQETQDAEDGTEEAPLEMPQTPSPVPPANAVDDPADVPAAPEEAPEAEAQPPAEPTTYAETAQNVDPSFRVPATATYDFSTQPAPITHPATPEPSAMMSPVPLAIPAPSTAPLSLPVQAQQLAGGDVSIELFGAQRNLVARLFLKGLIPQNQVP